MFNSMGPYQSGQNAAIAEQIMKKHSDRIKDVESARRSAGGSFSQEQALKLGLLLESVDCAYAEAASRYNASRLDESTQTGAVAAGLKIHTLDIITGVYPNLIAEDLVSVQPVMQKKSQIFHLKYTRGTTRGNLTAGGTLFDQFQTAGYENRNYSAELVEDETQGDFPSGAATHEFYLDHVPLVPSTVLITVDSVTLVDDGNGVISGTGFTGTVDYATGMIKLTASTAPSSDLSVDATYQQDLSYAPAKAAELNLEIRDTMITAHPRKLRTLFSLDAAYDIERSQGINMAQSLKVAAAHELRHETDGDIIMDLWNRTTKTVTFTDNYDAATAGISRRDFLMTFIDAINEACSSIYQDTKRVRGNWIVCGRRAQDILTSVGAPRFVGSAQPAAGPYYAGMIDNTIKVYFDPFLGENDFLVGYKGTNWLDSGYVYAPYMMFYSTDLIMMDDFLGRRGFATSYGKKFIEGNLYRKGTIVKM